MKTVSRFLRWWWLWLLGVILCAFPAVFLFEKLGWMEFKYEARAVIEVKPIVDVDPTLGNGCKTWRKNTEPFGMGERMPHPTV
ncbi:MAG: hypothetical protein H7A51_19555 [Akkermansiaceae bacterium]|nr:hypothetical protein [Akkermansiaceae bacterium]